MSETIVKVPDLGGADNVEVIEVSVSVGDEVEAEQTLIVLESDKASMEIPATQSGVVKAISVKTGDKVSEGSAIMTLDVVADQEIIDDQKAPVEEEPEVVAVSEEPEPPSAESHDAVSVEKVTVPDLGGASGIEVIEINVAVGDMVAEDDTLLVLESDKASMEIPAPFAGRIRSLSLTVGDKVDEGALIAELEVAGQVTDTSSE